MRATWTKALSAGRRFGPVSTRTDATLSAPHGRSLGRRATQPGRAAPSPAWSCSSSVPLLPSPTAARRPGPTQHRNGARNLQVSDQGNTREGLDRLEAFCAPFSTSSESFLISYAGQEAGAPRRSYTKGVGGRSDRTAARHKVDRYSLQARRSILERWRQPPSHRQCAVPTSSDTTCRPIATCLSRLR